MFFNNLYAYLRGIEAALQRIYIALENNAQNTKPVENNIRVAGRRKSKANAIVKEDKVAPVARKRKKSKYGPDFCASSTCFREAGWDHEEAKVLRSICDKLGVKLYVFNNNHNYYLRVSDFDMVVSELSKMDGKVIKKGVQYVNRVRDI